MALNGIDVSSNQPANIFDLVKVDFGIVKATGNPKGYKYDYYNPYMVQQVDAALKKTGCAGLYHFTHGGQSAETEADFFLSKVQNYIGRVMLIIDYENKATDNGREWLRAFIKRIKSKTGVNPVVYASSSVINSQSLVALCKEENCGIWSANYWAGSKAINGYNTNGLKIGVPESIMWQYTEYGYLSGYNGRLDLDIFYGDKDAWLAYAKGNGQITPVEPPVSDSKLDEDGKWGVDTTKALQSYFGTPVDGEIWGQNKRGLDSINDGGIQWRVWKIGNGGSAVIRALQKLVGANPDGLFGSETLTKCQRYFGTFVDGKLSNPSAMVKEMQRRLNRGKL